jgi:hypothetical protein
MRTQLLNKNDIDKWRPLLNESFSFGQKYMGEFAMGAEWVKAIISHKDNKEYLNFGDIPFTQIGYDNFFVQTSQGNHIMTHWMFHKVHNHITPVVFDLVNKSYTLVDTTRILAPKRLWQVDNDIYGEFSETIWIDSKRHEKLVTIKISDNFQDIESFYGLDPNKLKVAIYQWNDKTLSITID